MDICVGAYVTVILLFVVLLVASWAKLMASEVNREEEHV